MVRLNFLARWLATQCRQQTDVLVLLCVNTEVNTRNTAGQHRRTQERQTRQQRFVEKLKNQVGSEGPSFLNTYGITPRVPGSIICC